MLVDLDYQNILVTGGAGFMGSSFIRHLLSLSSFKGKVVNYDALTYCGNLENVKEVYGDERYKFVHGNILNQKLVEDVLAEEEISLVVHFAAETHVDRSIEAGAAFIQTNVLGTCSLLEAVRKFPDLHFHHVSTDEVYGSLELEGKFSEDSSYRPNSPYAASKASADHFVQAYHKTYGIATTLSHAGNNYGPYQFPEKLIPFILTRLFKKAPLPIYGKGDHVREWLYVEDHSRAIEAILREGKIGEIYNIPGTCEMKNLDLVKLLIHSYAAYTNTEVASLENLIIFTKDRPGHDFRYAMHHEKLLHDIGWQPLCTLQGGLEKTMLWYLNHQEWLEKVNRGEYQQWVQRQYSTLALDQEPVYQRYL